MNRPLSRSPSIALVTYSALPELAADDRLLAAHLRALGSHAVPVVWDDPAVAWDTFDAAVLRSCWDYHLRLGEFLEWLGARERSDVAVWNPPAVLRWNARKTYLRDLAAKGVTTVPTRWLGGDSHDPIEPLVRVLDDAGWSEGVVKPVVSASAYGTWRVKRDEAEARREEHDAHVRALAGQGGAMIQPYLSEFARDGEWSFMFFDGVFSHAVIKRPAPGDFRVQREFGGSAEPAEPSEELTRQARAAVEASPASPLYARVDGVVVGGTLLVTELELIEPSLFLDADPRVPGRFARAIMGRVAGAIERART